MVGHGAPDVSVHAARVTARAPWARWRADRSGVDLEENLIRGARQFAAMRLSSVAVGHSSSSFLGGKGWTRRSSRAVPDPVLGAGASSRPTASIVWPRCAPRASSGLSWCCRRGSATTRWLRDCAIYADHGFRSRAICVTIPAPHGGTCRRAISSARAWASSRRSSRSTRRLFRPVRPADGVLIAGTGFRCVGIIEALEQEMQRPVITANQASLWQCLRLRRRPDENRRLREFAAAVVIGWLKRAARHSPSGLNWSRQKPWPNGSPSMAIRP